MKTLIVMLLLLMLCINSYAQTIDPQFRMLPPIKKELKLDHFAKPSLPDLKPFKSPESITNRLKKPVTIYNGFSSQETSPARLKFAMPIMKPDSTINFPILATRPDSAVHHHMQIRKVK